MLAAVRMCIEICIVHGLYGRHMRLTQRVDWVLQLLIDIHYNVVSRPEVAVGAATSITVDFNKTFH